MIKNLLRRLLGPVNIRRIREGKASLAVFFYRLFSLHPRLSLFYYLVFSSEFNRECHTVLKGKVKYHKTHRRFDTSSSALLRRNIHRLEKGLIMRPRRDVFAGNYIEDTVVAYAGMLSSKEFCPEERKWGTDVLSRYFDVVKDNENIKRARQRYEALNRSGENEYVPYKDQDRTRTSITQEQLVNLFKQRRSTRWFKQQSVESEKIDTAIEMAALAPSACNRQPFQFYVMNQQNNAAEVAKMAAGTGGFAENIPTLIAVVGDLSAYPFERDRHLIYVDGALAAMQLMLAFETLDLSTCPINWPDIEFRERKIAKFLNLESHQRVIMLMAIGYAEKEGMIPYSSKKTTTSLRVNIDEPTV